MCKLANQNYVKKYIEVSIFIRVFDIWYEHVIFEYLFHCKICCHRKILRLKGVNL